MNGELKAVFARLGLSESNFGTYIGPEGLSSDKIIVSVSPVDGNEIGSVAATTRKQYDSVIAEAQKAFLIWREIPAPRRGEIVRQFGIELRNAKEYLGKLVSWEMGKSLQEGLGEVQEMIDICDFATGLSRQLHGLTMHSERPGHRMYEQYHPAGLLGVISAFNFPVAVWSWNAAIAMVCGDCVIWKPSEKVPLCAVACQQILGGILRKNKVPDAVSCLINGDAKTGQWLCEDERIPLISATGSTRMGKSVGKAVASRLGRSLLELGGNNAIIISEFADIDMALNAALFGAVGTAGQRCTTTRRLIIHKSRYTDVKHRIKSAYAKLKIGNPIDAGNHMGPLIDRNAVDMYSEALNLAVKQGCKVLVKGGIIKGRQFESGCYVRPAVFEASNDAEIVQRETFAPILYIMKYDTIDEAIAMQNNVKQGLSSAVMTQNLSEAEKFLSASGSDCGIANINIGTSGAEIGGAFGGEKETGGGRESGSDAWKFYMRRQTDTINYSTSIPLAQGVQFKI